jgi:hypothetical protein
MNKPMTRAELEALAVHSADLMADLVQKETEIKRRGPWSKGQEGRKRRKMRRAARAAKAAWLYS